MSHDVIYFPSEKYFSDRIYVCPMDPSEPSESRFVHRSQTASIGHTWGSASTDLSLWCDPIIIYSVFSVFRLYLFFDSQSDTFFKSLFNAFVIMFTSELDLSNWVSPVNILHLASLRQFGRSFMYNRNNKGQVLTPVVFHQVHLTVEINSHQLDSTVNNWINKMKTNCGQYQLYHNILVSLTLFGDQLCQMLFLRSRKMTSFNSPISTLWYSLSVISSKAVTVECPCLKPC